MSGTFYKGLGFVVWKGGIWYVRHRYGGVRRIGGRALVVAVAITAVAVAQRRNSRAG